jgi:uncharacterized cofD-like protein
VAAPSRSTRAVALGGGHGTARTLGALPRIADHVTAIVTVADNGGSSGRLRRDLDVVAPGDLRMALTALARDPELARLVAYRFAQGELAGHSLGNLMIVALQSLAGGDLVTALDRCAELLDVPGRVLPCTTVPVTLHAAREAGEVTGQVAVAATSRLQRVWLEPADPPPAEEAIAAIEAADLVVLGPGSLFTSLLPNLLVPGVAAAMSRTTAPVVLVTNLREQAGETEGMTLVDQVAALHAHVRGLHLDVIVSHAGASPSGPGAALHGDPDLLAPFADRVVIADLLDGEDGHDPDKLAAVLASVLPG